jgi:hypothetical protein
MEPDDFPLEEYGWTIEFFQDSIAQGLTMGQESSIACDKSGNRFNPDPTKIDQCLKGHCDEGQCIPN